MSEVIALAGWPPEVLAYAYAKYSRSALSIKQSIKEITAEKSGKFLEDFYFKFGHKSIADNAHIPLAFERISEIAAFTIEDEQLWDGSEQSTRFQNFKNGGYYIPLSIRGTHLEARYIEIAEFLLRNYQWQSDECFRHLQYNIQKPEDMKEDLYERTLKARAFDVARYWLFGGILTNVGQVTSARTLESQICRLMSSEYPEIKELGLAMKKACTETPFCPDDKNEPPLVPTLVKYTEPNDYLVSLRELMQEKAKEWLYRRPFNGGRYVKLAPPMTLTDEIVATLFFEASSHSFSEILEVVQSIIPEKEKQKIIELALERRGRHDPLPKAFACGYQIQFDVVMDRGGERDLHRHRNCIQIHQPLNLNRGYDRPKLVEEMNQNFYYDRDMMNIGEKIKTLKREMGIEADYLIPFAYRSTTLYKMHLAEAVYLTELRSGIKGHFSYREIACEMHRQLIEKYPTFANHFRVTPFETVDLLKR
jgi:thymidylate synthase ThyX